MKKGVKYLIIVLTERSIKGVDDFVFSSYTYSFNDRGKSSQNNLLLRAISSLEKKNRDRTMKAIILLAALVLLCMISSSNGKRLFYNNDNDMELSDKKARMFLRGLTGEEEDDDDTASFDTRESGRNCVKCKFGINPCCAPNICIKKSFRPDECMEIKQGKK